jgi:(p)ppGpp synthase/HD superfamily hydrolase
MKLDTDRFSRALDYATRAHAEQMRKGSGIPYVSHLLAVAALVLEDGGDEDEAIAALLHDAVEDQGGAERLADVEREFGPRVAAIVESCSDSLVVPKPPWRERKAAYIAHLEEAEPPAVRVSLADKVHNVRTIVLDYRRLGEALWTRFDPDADPVWYYRSLAGVFARRSSSPLVAEFDREVTELETLTQSG